MLAIENGTVYTPERMIPDGVVVVEGRRIAAVGRAGEIAVPADADRVDARGGLIVPGLIDMHVHGIQGYDVMDGTVESVQAFSRALTRYGVTAFVPSTTTATLEAVERALEAVAAVRKAGAAGAEVLGAHLEGPWLSEQERGAHRVDLLRVPGAEDRALVARYADSICWVTLAPELQGALEMIRELKRLGILVSAGHSVAMDTEMEAAVTAGVSHATHMFCNMGTLRRNNLRRVAGVVEWTLQDERMTTEIICDGYHIAPSLARLALQVKGAGRLAAVTDGMPLTGKPPGTYRIWGKEVIVEEHRAFVADRSSYAGSVATMDHCLRWIVENLECSFEDALRMVSLTPATILGVQDRKGSLEAGKDADVVVLDGRLQVAATIAAGRVC
jgi:N-acetylglucosamine-6-phosphate deacetylase